MTVGKMRFNIELLPESYAEEEKNRELREEAESTTARWTVCCLEGNG